MTERLISSERISSLLWNSVFTNISVTCKLTSEVTCSKTIIPNSTRRTRWKTPTEWCSQKTETKKNETVRECFYCFLHHKFRPIFRVFLLSIEITYIAILSQINWKKRKTYQNGQWSLNIFIFLDWFSYKTCRSLFRNTPVHLFQIGSFVWSYRSHISWFVCSSDFNNFAISSRVFWIPI